MASLEEEAQKRRERLKAYRKESREEEELETDSTVVRLQPEGNPLSRMKFRSYAPKSQELLSNVLLLPTVAPLNVEDVVEGQSDAQDQVELVNLAPRKPDWDLKRDVRKSLERLERRTQRAIAEIIRERLADAKGEVDDLAETVTWGAKAQEEAPFDEW